MDLNTQIINAYTSQKYLECIDLINTAPEISTHLKTLKASCLINLSNSMEAFGILNEIIKTEPNGLAFYSLGLAHLKEGKLEESIECFNKAATLDTNGAINKQQLLKLKEDVLRMKSEIIKKSSESTVKKEPKNRDYTCNVCQRKFAQSFSLSRHFLIHTGERPHRCIICDAGFIQKSDLNRHMTIHDDSTNHSCKICEKKFKTKKNLSSHLLVHSELRPYKCKVCDKDFRYKRLLKYHEGLHLDTKPFNCDHCGE